MQGGPEKVSLIIIAITVREVGEHQIKVIATISRFTFSGSPCSYTPSCRTKCRLSKIPNSIKIMICICIRTSVFVATATESTKETTSCRDDRGHVLLPGSFTFSVTNHRR